MYLRSSDSIETLCSGETLERTCRHDHIFCHRGSRHRSVEHAYSQLYFIHVVGPVGRRAASQLTILS